MRTLLEKGSYTALLDLYKLSKKYKFRVWSHPHGYLLRLYDIDDTSDPTFTHHLFNPRQQEYTDIVLAVKMIFTEDDYKLLNDFYKACETERKAKKIRPKEVQYVFDLYESDGTYRFDLKAEGLGMNRVMVVDSLDHYTMKAQRDSIQKVLDKITRLSVWDDPVVAKYNFTFQKDFPVKTVTLSLNEEEDYRDLDIELYPGFTEGEMVKTIISRTTSTEALKCTQVVTRNDKWEEAVMCFLAI